MSEAIFENNKIDRIHSDLIYTSTLEKINLSNNKITAVRSDFKQLKDLSELKMQHNKIKDIPDFF